MTKPDTRPGYRVPHLLRLFTMALKIHRRMTPRQVAAEAGVSVSEVNAVLRGGAALVSAGAQMALARWNDVSLVALGGEAEAVRAAAGQDTGRAAA